MKKLKQSLWFLMIIIPVCSAQDGGRVFFYRENYITGAAVSYPIYANDINIGHLKNASYFIFNCTPGRYVFRVGNLKNTMVSLNVTKGRSYYLRFNINMGMWSALPELIVVDSVSAYPVIKSGMLKYVDMNSANIRNKNRFGINTGLGFGFENVAFFTTTSGDDSKVSFGGGYGIGLGYGREIGKFFDLSLDMSYQFSDLRPTLKNASVTFGRFIISATPALLLQFKKQDAMRLRFGAGPDYYISGMLNIKGSKVPGGFDDKWKYSNKAGFHITGIFEMDISDKWSLDYGLKYYNVSYNFISGGSTYPTDVTLKYPSGSGLDFLFGFFYRF